MEFLTIAQVCAKTNLSRSTIFRLEKAGTFPQRICVGARVVRWYARDVDSWLELRCHGGVA